MGRASERLANTGWRDGAGVLPSIRETQTRLLKSTGTGEEPQSSSGHVCRRQLLHVPALGQTGGGHRLQNRLTRLVVQSRVRGGHRSLRDTHHTLKLNMAKN